jgi:hypothetical protein
VFSEQQLLQRDKKERYAKICEAHKAMYGGTTTIDNKTRYIANGLLAKIEGDHKAVIE